MGSNPCVTGMPNKYLRHRLKKTRIAQERDYGYCDQVMHAQAECTGVLQSYNALIASFKCM